MLAAEQLSHTLLMFDALYDVEVHHTPHTFDSLNILAVACLYLEDRGVAMHATYDVTMMHSGGA